MVAFLASTFSKVGVTALTTSISYTSKVVGGHVTLRALSNTVTGMEQTGTRVAGSFGKSVGTILGRVVAGHAVPLAKYQGSAVTVAVDALGKQAVEALNPNERNIVAIKTNIKEEKPVESKGSYLLPTSKTVLTIGAIGAISLSGAYAVPAGMAFVAVQTAPKLFNALKNEVKANDQSIDLVDHILVPVATQATIGLAGFCVEGLTIYSTIEKAYDLSVLRGETIGKTLGSYMPEVIQNALGTIGRAVGHLDAGRFATSEEMIKQATQAGADAKAITETTLEVVNATMTTKTEKQNKAWSTAKKAMVLFGGATLIVAAPTIAATASLTAAIRVTPDMVNYVKQKMMPAQPTPVEQQTEENQSSDNQTATETSAEELEAEFVSL